MRIFKINVPFLLVMPDYLMNRVRGLNTVGFNAAVQTFGDPKGGESLDHGCAYGRSTRFLYDSGHQDLIGVDPSPDRIRMARSLNPDLEFRVINGSIPLSGESIDRALSAFVHIEISDYATFIEMHRDLSRVVRPGGVYTILTMNPEMWGVDFGIFSSNFVDSEKSEPSSGDPVQVTIRNGDKNRCFLDYYWLPGDYTKSLSEAGFETQAILTPDTQNNGPSPFMVITSIKQ